MKAKRQTFEIVSAIGWNITGRLRLCDETRGPAKTWARKHSRTWRTRTVFVCLGGFPLYAYRMGKEVSVTDCCIPPNLGELLNTTDANNQGAKCAWNEEETR